MSKFFVIGGRHGTSRRAKGSGSMAPGRGLRGLVLAPEGQGRQLFRGIYPRKRMGGGGTNLDAADLLPR